MTGPLAPKVQRVQKVHRVQRMWYRPLGDEFYAAFRRQPLHTNLPAPLFILAAGLSNPNHKNPGKSFRFSGVFLCTYAVMREG